MMLYSNFQCISVKYMYDVMTSLSTLSNHSYIKNLFSFRSNSGQFNETINNNVLFFNTLFSYLEKKICDPMIIINT